MNVCVVAVSMYEKGGVSISRRKLKDSSDGFNWSHWKHCFRCNSWYCPPCMPTMGHIYVHKAKGIGVAIYIGIRSHFILLVRASGRRQNA